MRVDIAPIPDDFLWAIKSPYSPAMIRILRENVPGTWWSDRNRAWVGYRDAVRLAGRQLAKHGFDVQGALPSINDWKAESFPFAIADTGLAEYQKEAARFAIARAEEGALICLAPGAGKSAVGLRAARALRGAGRTLIIAPASVKSSWTMDHTEMGQIKRWWRAAFGKTCKPEGVSPGEHDWHYYIRKGSWGCRACGVEEGLSDPEHAPPLGGCALNIPTNDDLITIINYDLAHAWKQTLLDWGFATIILDEIDVCANEKSQRYRAISELVGHARYKIGLTGTPFHGKPATLYGVVNLISPGRFGGYFDRSSGEFRTAFLSYINEPDGRRKGIGYGVRYCGGVQETIPGMEMQTVWTFKGVTRPKELGARLRHFMMYRTKEDLGLQLPPMTTVITEVDVKKKFSYRVDPYAKKDRGAVRRSLGAAADGKIPHVVARAVEEAEAGHKKIIFTVRRALAEAITNQLVVRGVKANFIHGGVSRKNREKLVAAAREMREQTGYVLVCTIETMGVGIDLTFADIADFAELTFEPHEIDQARARLHRRRQTKNVLIRIWAARGTTDDMVKDIILKKLKAHNAIVGKTDGALENDLDTRLKGQDALDDLYTRMKKRYEREQREAAA